MRKTTIGLVLLLLSIYSASEGRITTESGDLKLSPASHVVHVEGVVGVGTASPYYRLTVKEDTTEGAVIAEFINKNNEGLAVAHSGSNGGLFWNLPDNTVAIAADYHSGQGSPQYRDLALVTKNNPRITIKKDGKIGIGTTSPWSMLHVHGTSVSFSDDENYAISFLPGYNNQENRIYSNYGVGASDKKLILGTYSGQEDQLVLDTNGNVGVGTTNPEEKLDVDGNIQASGDFGYKYPYDSAAGDFIPAPAVAYCLTKTDNHWGHTRPRGNYATCLESCEQSHHKKCIGAIHYGKLQYLTTTCTDNTANYCCCRV